MMRVTMSRSGREQRLVGSGRGWRDCAKVSGRFESDESRLL
jgi:hypothetical protein